MKSKGQMAAGMLIFLIAMLIAVSITAFVLVQSITSVENRAVKSSSQGSEQVTTAMEPITLIGFNTTPNSYVLTDFHYQVKLPYGDGVRLNDLAMELDYRNLSGELKYITGQCIPGTAGGGGYYTDKVTGDGNYTVKYLFKGKEFIQDYIHKGDIIQICFRMPYPIVDDTLLNVGLIPKVGRPILMEIVTPNVIHEERTVLFP